MNSWNYEPAIDLDQTTIERLRRFPREPDMTVYGLRTALALVIRIWLRLYHRLEITGSEHLPRKASFILAANHASHLDTLCLLAALPLRKLHRAFPAAARDYFFVSVPRLALATVAVNALPFGRQKDIRQSLAICGQLLANPGNILVLFPEGTRTATGKIGAFKPGIGLLVAGTNIAVVPCHLRGTFEAWPKGASWPRPRKLHLHIGVPRTYAAMPSGTAGAEQISLDLRQAVCDLAQPT
jgi:1-acyl-sn-glycerol-3-phosphate acyltransferase